MSNDHTVICGGADAAGLPCPQKPLLLRKDPPNQNVTVRIEDVRDGLWREVPGVFLDLIDVAAYVYAADQSIARGTDQDADFGARWRRRMRFAIPVRFPQVWSRPRVRDILATTLSFLSEDEYEFRFSRLPDPPPADSYLQFGTDRFAGTVEEVLLFSGGLDSLAGAVLQAVTNGRQVLLVQHRSSQKVATFTRDLLRDLAGKAPARPPILLPVRVGKAQALTKETTQRSRSFLYAALGAAVAAMLRLDRVRFYENGVVSLNLPPATQVVGARASRSTHPRVLQGLTELFSKLAGRPFAVENPFQWDTKADVVEAIVRAGCAELIGRTRSCAHPRQRSDATPHCGVCSQCIDRRFAVLATGQGEHDPPDGYNIDLLSGPRDEGKPQTMLAVYAEMARQVAGMSAASFFGRFGEVSRVLPAIPEPAGVVAHRVFDLYRRHARQVNEVIQRGIADHAAELFQRTLPPSCLLCMVCGGGGDSAPAPAADPPPLGQNVFRLKGEVWQVRYAGGADFLLLPSKGAAYLHLLLQRPGRPLSVVEMAATVARHRERFALGDAGDVLDADAMTAYRARHEELAAMIDKERRAGNEVVLEQLRQEQRDLLEQLRQGGGLAGRVRKASDDRNKVRVAVRAAIRRAVADIAKYDRRLAEHLCKPRLQCGYNPCYLPGEEVPWET